jgi:hypothetical protein
MFQSGNSVSVTAHAMLAPPMALIGPSRLPDGPRIALVTIRTKPIHGLGSIPLPPVPSQLAVPAPFLSESLFLLALCLLLRGVAVKARQRLS